ncbi:I78 family peptidase inhibitor [Sphingomonas sp. NIBR02145]|uniref:I78 family peptidase inhibitor n=1 Tax=Sphingomonas sp. NIBR02145 TaxID=3014784 RepID=UPI0022B3D35C|nr:I78 family peptidase inhibitor [Sphingomonas sp. NIBR02145]WHU03938.1 I78 family peptidase inhibitor [Sphingomonas sp. NIBR02145]
MRAIGTIATALLVAGCMNDGRPTPMPGPRICNAGVVQRFIGAPMSPQLQPRLRARSGASSVRVVRPGEAVTMDFRRDRLTVDVNQRGRISGLRCV